MPIFHRGCLRAALCLLAMALLILPTRAADRENLDVVLALDNSGSMYDSGVRSGNDMRFMRITAAQYFLEKMARGDRAAVVLFGSESYVPPEASRLQEVTGQQNRARFFRGLARFADLPQGGETRMDLGLAAAAGILRRDSSPGRRRFLILLTDGNPNPRRDNNTPDKLVAFVNGLAREGIVTWTIGLGELDANPRAAQEAERLLAEMARVGGGALLRARQAGDLPALFGKVFARLVGHEVSIIGAGQQEQAFNVAPGTRHLRLLAVSEGASPEMTVTDPKGDVRTITDIPPILDEARLRSAPRGFKGRQDARMEVVSEDSPMAGTWRVVSKHGMVERAWEPNFEARFVGPAHNDSVPARARLTFTVVVQTRGESMPRAFPQCRVVVEYEREPGQPPMTVNLREADPIKPGVFVGEISDSGGVGPREARARCFRQGENGEEEGGPDHITLQVGRLPTLEMIAPAEGACYVFTDAIPVRAVVRLMGEPLRALPEGVRLQAILSTQAGEKTLDMKPAPDGGFQAQFPGGGAPGGAEARVTLSGRFEGRELPGTIERRHLSLLPRPVVELRWEPQPKRRANPADSLAVVARVRSSSGAPQHVRLTAVGLPGMVAEPAVLTIAPNQPERAVRVRLRWRDARPGDFPVRIEAALHDPRTDLLAAPYHGSVHIRTWMERNGWWFKPLVALFILCLLMGTWLVARYMKERERRLKKMRAMLAGVVIQVPGTREEFQPPKGLEKQRLWFTAGGKGADVELPNPKQPGVSYFKEPRMRIAVEWRRGGPKLIVTPVGAETIFFEVENGQPGKTIIKPIVPREGGAEFYIGPENIWVSVMSRWTM